MEISNFGIQFIIGWEGFRNQLYDDGGLGRGNCTIGVGHLVHLGPCDGGAEEVPYINGITDAQVADLLRTDITRYSDAVSSLMPNVTQCQYDALMDFAFNCGIGALEQLADTVNAGGDAAPIMRRFIHDGMGNVVDALVRRREAEIALYYQEEDDMKPFLAWDIDNQRAYLVGPFGAAWITNAADVATLEGLYGKTAVALHQSTLHSIATVAVVGA